MKIPGKYSDYLIIDREFEPVFNEEVDKTRKGLWKSFIPHSKFEEILDKVIKALERANPSDAKSLWIYGAYGTGKTHAVFVIKHLLEDSLEEVEDYFAKRKISDTLRRRLLALREREKILVVFKSGAGYVRTPERLILEVQDSIFKAYKKYLESQGLEYKPSKTDIELLRERINEDIINWDSLINKYRKDLKEVSSVEDIKRIISDDESIDLDFVERLLCVLEKEGISTLRPSIDRFKSWLRELFEAGIVTRIVFIWDEFSGFFQPGAPLDVLQELAHITQELPFYLLIVTHRHLEHWEQTLTEDVKKLKDRFHFIHYTMEPITVYMLISNVVYPKDESKWDWYRERLWMKLDCSYNLKTETHRLIEYEIHAELGDFKKLIPIHPYTAYLSARIIQWFGSSQRTLFKFLKSGEKSSFVEFLNEYPRDNWYLLTADFLWDYYFASNDEIITFYPEVLGIVNYWNSQKDKLDENELKVFKVVMLLSALAKKVEQERHLRPLLTTLKLAFAGTPLYLILENVLKQLVSRSVLREDKLATDKEYWIPTHDISPDIIDEIKKTLPNFSEFIKQIEKLFEDLKPHRRAVIRVVSAEDVLKGKIPTIRAKPYQIEVILILMKALERIEDLKNKVKELSQQYENTVFIISLQELGENNWETILTNMAYEKALKQSNKEVDARRYRAEIEEIISNWISNVRKGRYCIIYKLSEEDVTVNERVEGESGVQKIFRDIVRSIFPYGLDEIILSEPLWKHEYSKEGLRVAIEHFRTKAKKGRFSKLYDRFVSEDRILDKGGNFTDRCEFEDHPLCKMREKIRSLFDKSESVPLSEIWEILQNPPFGLYPSPLGSFVLGILMKEYSEGYYYTDGVTQGEINPTKMVEILYEVIKSQKEWKLLKLSPEHRKFCELIKKVFKLSDEEVKYPKIAIISLRNKIKNQYRYPLWILTFAIHSDEGLFDEDKKILINLITKLDNIVKTLPIEEKSSDVEITKDTEQLIKELMAYIDEQDSYIVNELTEFVRIDKFNDSFNIFVHQYIDDPRVDTQLVDKKLRERLQEEPWAWAENKVREILNKMQLEIKLTEQLSRLFGINEVFIEESCKAVRNKIKSLDFFPLWVYCYHPEVDENIKGILLEIEELVYSKRPLELGVNFKKIIENIDQNMSNLAKVLNESDIALKSWIHSKLNRELSDTELDAVLNKIREIITKSEDRKIEESQLLKEIQDVLKKLKVTLLQERIKQKLEDIFGTSDILQFYRSNFIPIALIKYLPEVENAKLPSEISADEFFRDLTKLNTLSEQKLELYIKILDENKQIFQALNERDIWTKLFKNFFGKEWIEGVFTDDDLKDLIEFLIKSLGENVENWDDRQIRKEFDKWKKIKYKERFYDRIQKMLNDLNENEVRNLLFKLIEDTDIGLRILDLLKGETI